MARTTRVVKRAIGAWARIFDFEVPILDLRILDEAASCTDLIRRVKNLLSNCPSSVEEERFAWQSIKKILPDSCKCMESSMLKDLASRLSRSPRVLPRGYMAFVRKTVRGLFKKGWDSGSYERHCLTVSPPLSATAETGRGSGGSLGDLAGEQFIFLNAVLLGEVPDDYEPSVEAEAIVVQSAGKPRPLSKFSSEALLLRPLHGALYDHLSRKGWLCRGTPTKESLEKAGFRRGQGVLVSGDYRSATDNLPLEVAEECMRVILETSVSVPDFIKKYAMRILRPSLFQLSEGIEFVPSVGQMMGSFLSFPLLCLQNFLAFRWAHHVIGSRERSPLQINGDDILFQGSESFAQTWIKVVGEVGLEVEVTKTSVSEEFGSLNSTLYRWNSEGLLFCVKTLRFGMLRPRQFIAGIGKTFYEFVDGQESGVKWRAARVFFDFHIKAMKQCRMTLPELGFFGSLAYRLGQKYSFLVDLCTVPPLPLPVGHNVVLSSDKFTKVPEEDVPEAVRELNNQEMVSWKWATCFESLRVRAVIRYLIGLSQVRSKPEPDFYKVLNLHYFLSGTGTEVVSRGQWRRRFFVRPKREKTVIVSNQVLVSQDLGYFDDFPLPSYEETQLPVFDDEDRIPCDCVRSSLGKAHETVCIYCFHNGGGT